MRSDVQSPVAEWASTWSVTGVNAVRRANSWVIAHLYAHARAGSTATHAPRWFRLQSSVASPDSSHACCSSPGTSWG